MKVLKKIIFFSFIVFPTIFILNIYNSIPSKLIITQNSQHSLSLNKFCQINSNKKIQSASILNEPLIENENGEISLNTSSCGKYTIPIKLFDKIPIKTISVTITPEKYVVPSGDTIGIKLYSKGLLVIALSSFTEQNGNSVSPAKSAGILKGDIITAINSQEVNTAEEFSEKINSLSTPFHLSICRENEMLDIKVKPCKSSDDGKTKLGMWIRDSTAGIGTLTYYDPTNSVFGALGHAICDSDTGDIIPTRKGNISDCKSSSIIKGKSGTPGELIGAFGDSTLGIIEKNTEFGIYGHIDNLSETNFSDPIPIATRFQIKEGSAEILSNIDGNGVRAYSAEIVKISKNAEINNKGIIIKITDPILIEKTGGIVQGMSGSPIIQNNMLVGAVTHVFVNDPTKGYGIFIENMLAEAEKTI